MRLSSICEHQIDPMRLLRKQFTPDRLVRVPGALSFMFVPADGKLWVDRVPNRSHSDWFDKDRDACTVYMLYNDSNDEVNKPVCGRLTPDYYGLPVVAFWRCADRALKAAARALLGELPDAVAVPYNTSYYEEGVVLPLAELAGVGGGMGRSRGHRYWQVRQTSESIVKRCGVI